MTRTRRIAVAAGVLLVAGAIGVTGAAVSGGGPTIPAAPAAATVPATGATAARTSTATSPRSPQDGSLGALAAALGVDEPTLRSAIDAARDQVRAQRPKPEGAAASHAAMIKAVAQRIGKPEAQVRDAFGAFLAAHQAGSRDTLSRRLDAAVAAGRLTEAERAAVLKAYDAGVLGRGAGAPGRMGHLGGPTKAPGPRS